MRRQRRNAKYLVTREAGRFVERTGHSSSNNFGSEAEPPCWGGRPQVNQFLAGR